MKKKKRQNLGPRRKRMHRESRLQAAQNWISTYSGKNIIRGYCRWYGVDVECAIAELKMLHVKLDEPQVNNILKCHTGMIAARKRQQEEKKNRISEKLNDLMDSDDTFYFIAGYTSGGAPFGVTWEEMEGVEF